jgi:hypothetical protein
LSKGDWGERREVTSNSVLEDRDRCRWDPKISSPRPETGGLLCQWEGAVDRFASYGRCGFLTVESVKLLYRGDGAARANAAMNWHSQSGVGARIVCSLSMGCASLSRADDDISGYDPYFLDGSRVAATTAGGPDPWPREDEWGPLWARASPY